MRAGGEGRPFPRYSSTIKISFFAASPTQMRPSALRVSAWTSGPSIRQYPLQVIDIERTDGIAPCLSRTQDRAQIGQHHFPPPYQSADVARL